MTLTESDIWVDIAEIAAITGMHEDELYAELMVEVAQWVHYLKEKVSAS